MAHFQNQIPRSKTNELVSKLRPQQEHKAVLVLRWPVHRYEGHITDTPGNKAEPLPLELWVHESLMSADI